MNHFYKIQVITGLIAILITFIGQENLFHIYFTHKKDLPA